jgi:Zn-dependent M28 family amino/carboxypeptidase
LIVGASPPTDALHALVDSAAAAAGLEPRYSSVIDDRSDHASFRRIGIPAISLFTGFHADYHRATDVFSRIDVTGIERVVDVAASIVRSAANRPLDLSKP